MVESKFNPGDEVYLGQRVIVRSINFTGIGVYAILEDNDGNDIGEYPIDNIHEDVSWTQMRRVVKMEEDKGINITCPSCGSCEMDYEGQDLYECPACGDQYRLERIGHTDNPKRGRKPFGT